MCLCTLKGFDDKGREYDHEGNLSDWWTAEDSGEYNRRTNLMVDQFEAYEVLGKHVNGKLTLGEFVSTAPPCARPPLPFVPR